MAFAMSVSSFSLSSEVVDSSTCARRASASAGRRLPDVHDKGTAMPPLAVQQPRAGEVTLVFDPGTGLLMQQRYGGGAGEPETEERFTDYRAVQGLQVAHRATLKRENNPPFERIVRSFEINVPIDSSFFKKPVTRN